MTKLTSKELEIGKKYHIFHGFEKSIIEFIISDENEYVVKYDPAQYLEGYIVFNHKDGYEFEKIPQTMTRWANIYFGDFESSYRVGVLFETQSEALLRIANHDEYVDTIEIKFKGKE